MSECERCGIEERVARRAVDGESLTLCAWCFADATGRPYGTCSDCHGGKAADGTCACKPTKAELVKAELVAKRRRVR